MLSARTATHLLKAGARPAALRPLIPAATIHARAFTNLPGGPSVFGGPPSYFRKEKLPANTIIR